MAAKIAIYMQVLLKLEQLDFQIQAELAENGLDVGICAIKTLDLNFIDKLL